MQRRVSLELEENLLNLCARSVSSRSTTTNMFRTAVARIFAPGKHGGSFSYSMSNLACQSNFSLPPPVRAAVPQTHVQVTVIARMPVAGRLNMARVLFRIFRFMHLAVRDSIFLLSSALSFGCSSVLRRRVRSQEAPLQRGHHWSRRSRQDLPHGCNHQRFVFNTVSNACLHCSFPTRFPRTCSVLATQGKAKYVAYENIDKAPEGPL
jgi:hypothetical protein